MEILRLLGERLLVRIHPFPSGNVAQMSEARCDKARGR